MEDTADVWGAPFDLCDLEAALSFAEDACLPVEMAHDNEGAPEVLWVLGRCSAQGPIQFNTGFEDVSDLRDRMGRRESSQHQLSMVARSESGEGAI